MVGKFDLDANLIIPARYGLSDRVAILIFKNGELMYQIFGMVDRETLEEQVAAQL